jgi:hypothetical protein
MTKTITVECAHSTLSQKFLLIEEKFWYFYEYELAKLILNTTIKNYYNFSLFSTLKTMKWKQVKKKCAMSHFYHYFSLF